MDPIFIPKKGFIRLADKCLLYQKADGTREQLYLEVHQHSFFFYMFNHSIPPSTSPLVPTELPDDQLRLAFHCVLMSYLAYEDRTQIIFPEDVPIVYEEFESDVTKIPFFVTVDKEVNAIIIACRGSSCTDDFITDSMGTGISFDGGKIHQGIFNTATYVFLKCRNVILDLNQNYNGEALQRKDTSQFDFSPKNRESKYFNETTENFRAGFFDSNTDNPMKIVCTGHSLGAGVAAVLAHIFRREFPKMKVEAMCFAPPPTLSFDLWEKSASYIKSFMIEGDIVPFLSLQNVVKFTKVLFPHDNNKYIANLIQKYLQKYTVDEISEKYLKEKLYPPGKCYLIRLPQTNPNREEKKKRRKLSKSEKKEMKAKNMITHQNICICQIFNPEYFSNFVKNIVESNHKCKNYIKVIVRLRQQQIQEKGIEEIFKRKNLGRIDTSDFDETEESGVERLV